MTQKVDTLEGINMPLRIAYDFRDWEIAINEEPKFPVSIIDSSEDFIVIFIREICFRKAVKIVEAMNARYN